MAAWAGFSLLSLLMLLPPSVLVAGQQMMPFPGNSAPEPSSPTEVFVSSYIDRLMFIDDKNYEFQAMVFVYLSWTDPRAKEQEAKNRAMLSEPNTNASCKMQCQLYPQNQPNPVQGCCDNIWLPYVSFPTLKLLSQDRVLRWGVNLDSGSDAVGYWSIILGTFMASFDLRAFPFDAQRLHVQMEVPGWAGGNVVLKPSSAGTRMFNTNPDGDALSGWRVLSVRMSTYSLPLCQRYTLSSSQPSAADDPAPLVSKLLFTDKQIRRQPSSCAQVLDQHRRDPSFLVYTRQNLDGSKAAEDQPLNVTGVTSTIVIKRYAAQWVMSAILPIIASTWLGFVVFLLPRDCLNSRLGTVLTIFVAQAAVQFVACQELPNSSYMTALHQMIAAGYVMLVMIGFESVVIWFITTYHQHYRRQKEHRQAHKQFTEELQQQLDVLKAKLSALLAEQDHNRGRSGISQSLASFRSASTALTDTLKAAKAQQLSSRRIHSSSENDARAAAAAAAVAAAAGTAPASEGFSGSKDVNDVAPKQGDTAKYEDAQRVMKEVQRLQQQLADHVNKQQQESRVEGEIAGARPDSVALDLTPAASGLLPEGAPKGHNPSCLPWRLCTSIFVYFDALKRNEALIDQLAAWINKWACITQFVGYNISVVMILVLNWALYRKD